MKEQLRLIQRLPSSLAIFDLDSCISDDEWRVPFIKSHGADRFAEYHDNLHKDERLHHGAEKLEAHLAAGYGIIFITARPDNVRAETEEWLYKNFRLLRNVTFCLFMRESHNEGVGSVKIKQHILSEIKTAMAIRHEIFAAYDDRPDIVKMYLDNGIANAKILDKKGLRAYQEGDVTVLPFAESSPEAEKGDPELPRNELPRNEWPSLPNDESTPKNAGDILEESLAVFRERNALYGDNADKLAKIFDILFPEGIEIKSSEDHKLMLQMYLLVTKLTRFTNSGMTHQDSIRDLVVYAALTEVAAEHRISTVIQQRT